MPLSLGIDLGTSSVKASLVDVERGRRVASAIAPNNHEIPRFVYEPGWCEQDPNDWWSSCRMALSELGADKLSEVVSIGVAYQMHGLVLVDENLEPVRLSIIWSDGRAVAQGEALVAECPGLIARTYNAPGNFTASKLRWVKDNFPEILARARYAFLPGDYIIAKLCGVAQTSQSGVSEMAGWDFGDSKVADDLFFAASGRDSILPPVVPNIGVQAKVDPSVASLLGLNPGAVVSYRAGDQPNNALSLNVLNPGETAATAGTSGVLYAVSDHAKVDSRARVNTFLHVNSTALEPRLGTLLCVNGTGACYSWCKKLLGAQSFEQLNGWAEMSEIGANGVSLLPYGNGAERSLGNRYIGAQASGIDLNRNNRDDFARACQEGIVFALKFGFESFRDLGIESRIVRAGTDNMFRSELFSQTFATAMGVTLELFETDGSEGAARAAALGAGIYKSSEEAFGGTVAVRKYEPSSPHQTAMDESYARWTTALQKALRS